MCGRTCRYAVLAIGLLALFIGLWLARIYHSYGNLDPSTLVSAAIGSDPVTRFAPDGRHYLTTEVCRRTDGEPNSYLCIQLKIYDKGGRLLQKVNTHASDVHRWDVVWKDNETILLSSSDIGDQEYARLDRGEWRRTDR
jgi:hypothetical protein